MYPHRIRLHGPWDYEPQSRTVIGPDGVSEEVASDCPASGRMRIPTTWRNTPLQGFRGRVRWSRRFHSPRSLEPDERVWITFGGVDYFADVSVNGEPVGRHEGYFEPFAFDITELLAPANELIVVVDCPAERLAGEPRMIRGELEARTPEFVAGIWRDVALEIRSLAYLSQVTVNPSLDNGQGVLQIDGTVHGRSQIPLHLNLTIDDTDVERLEVRLEDGATRFAIQAAVPGAKLWWPAGLGSAPLSSVRLELHGAARTLDTVQRRVGFRDLDFDWPASRGTINGRSMALRVVAITPAGCPLFTDCSSLSGEPADTGNLPIVRVSGRVIDPSVYDWADEHGVLLIQDVPIAAPHTTAEVLRQRQAILQLLAHHASIACFQDRAGWI